MFFSVYINLLTLIVLLSILLNLSLVSELVIINKLVFTLFFTFNLNFFFIVIIFISLFVTFFISFYMVNENAHSYFIILTVLFVLSILLLILSNSMFIIFLGWEGLGFSSFLLICYYNNWESISNSLVTLFSNNVGDVWFLFLFSIFLFDVSSSYPNINNIFWLLLFTVITKCAQFPFISWLPIAMSAPTPISSLVHSSTLVTAGLLLLTNFVSVSPLNISESMFILCCTSMIISSYLGFNSNDFNNIVAYSTLSQISLIILSLSINLIEACFFHLYTHAFFNSLLFFSVGNIIHNNNSNQDLRNFSSTFCSSDYNSSVIIITLLSISSLLFISGFYSNENIFEVILSYNNKGIILIFYFSFCLTLIYSINMFIAFYTIYFICSYNIENSSQFILCSVISVSLSLYFGFIIFSNSLLSLEFLFWGENCSLLILIFSAFVLMSLNTPFIINAFSSVCIIHYNLNTVFLWNEAPSTELIVFLTPASFLFSFIYKFSTLSLIMESLILLFLFSLLLF